MVESAAGTERLSAALRPTGMDYCMDAGDGTADILHNALDTDTDSDGVLDAYRLDIDGLASWADHLLTEIARDEPIPAPPTPRLRMP